MELMCFVRECEQLFCKWNSLHQCHFGDVGRFHHVLLKGASKTVVVGAAKEDLPTVEVVNEKFQGCCGKLVKSFKIPLVCGSTDQ